MGPFTKAKCWSLMMGKVKSRSLDKDTGFRSGMMEQFMKVSGMKIKLMVEERSGMLKETSMLESLEMTKLMGSENTHMSMGLGTPVLG